MMVTGTKRSVRPRSGDTFSSMPTASGGIARAAYAASAKKRLDVTTQLQKAQISLEEIQAPAKRILVQRQIAFLNETAVALRDEFLGFHLAQSTDLRELGLLFYVFASADNLDEGLKRLARYSTIHNEGVHINISSQKQLSIEFSYVGVRRSSDKHQIEFFFTILLRSLRALTGIEISPIRIQFAHRRGTIPPHFYRFFTCEPEFGSAVDAMAFELGAKAFSLNKADPYLSSILVRYCEDILRRRHAKPGDWRANTENAIAPLLPHGEAGLENVAQKMGVSPRTLSRRLRVEGVKFWDVLDHLRERLSKSYLKDELSITQAAWLLGYHETSSFSHAFKRWTGVSPRSFRSRLRQKVCTER